MENTSFEIASYAKINLFLEVLGKQESGYHDLVTLFAEINLCDFLKFDLTKKGGLKILSSLDSLSSRDNLIYQVAVYIQAKYRVQYGAKIYLEKNIPIAAGLGGGSSNTAATIDGLCRLWGLDLAKAEKHEIASRFGSDINFFLEGFLAIGTNRGEVIEPLDSDLYFDNILLVNPNYPISSGEAYQLLSPPSHPHKCGGIQMLLEKKDPIYCFNRLEEGVLRKYPDLQEIKNLLIIQGAKKAMLSGSGPTMIAFFSDPTKCKNARNLVEGLNYRAYITSIRRRQHNENH